jgi:hypothetical protein
MYDPKQKCVVEEKPGVNPIIFVILAVVAMIVLAGYMFVWPYVALDLGYYKTVTIQVNKTEVSGRMYLPREMSVFAEEGTFEVLDPDLYGRMAEGKHTVDVVGDVIVGLH